MAESVQRRMPQGPLSHHSRRRAGPQLHVLRLPPLLRTHGSLHGFHAQRTAQPASAGKRHAVGEKSGQMRHTTHSVYMSYVLLCLNQRKTFVL